jgi:hypothetical protein
MSSRQSTVAYSVSQNLLQYAAPASFSVVQNDIGLSNQSGNPALAGLINGIGSTAANTQTLPILSSSGAVHGLTSSSTTATCTLGSPHGFAVAASSVLVTVTANNSAYNVTAASATITGPYTFTYTTSGSNLAISDGGTVQISVPTWTATQSASVGGTAAVLPAGTTVGGGAKQIFSSAIPGQTINGQVVGTLELWGDGTLWDLSNNRAIVDNFSIDTAIQYHGS